MRAACSDTHLSAWSRRGRFLEVFSRRARAAFTPTVSEQLTQRIVETWSVGCTKLAYEGGQTDGAPQDFKTSKQRIRRDNHKFRGAVL